MEGPPIHVVSVSNSTTPSATTHINETSFQPEYPHGLNELWSEGNGLESGTTKHAPSHLFIQPTFSQEFFNDQEGHSQITISQIPSTTSTDTMFAPPFQKNGDSSTIVRVDSSGITKTIPELSSHNDALHDEFLHFVRDSGMENLAKDAGIIQNGVITEMREYSAHNSLDGSFQSPRKQTTPRAPDFISPDKRFQTRIGSPYQLTKLPLQSSSTPSSQAAQSSETKITNIEEISTVETTTSSRKKRKSGAKETGNPTSPSQGEGTDRLAKGLRHFSLKVCQKVEKKKKTTYNEVADDLVNDLTTESGGAVDQKNIRRRVYDALNVLMAMGIISKEKKEIQWIGLPTNTKQDVEALEKEKENLQESVKRKKANVTELLSQVVAYKNLLDRNTKIEQTELQNSDHLNLPFIIVNTKSQTVISLEVAEDRSTFFFNFSLPFEIHDDSEILKRMGLGEISGGNDSSK